MTDSGLPVLSILIHEEFMVMDNVPWSEYSTWVLRILWGAKMKEIFCNAACSKSTFRRNRFDSFLNSHVVAFLSI